MAKRSRKDNWKKKRRQEHLELKEYQYYIFGEGQQTEPQYYTANNHCSEYSSFLNEKFTELGLGKYRKKMENIFERWQKSNKDSDFHNRCQSTESH